MNTRCRRNILKANLLHITPWEMSKPGALFRCLGTADNNLDHCLQYCHPWNDGAWDLGFPLNEKLQANSQTADAVISTHYYKGAYIETHKLVRNKVWRQAFEVFRVSFYRWMFFIIIVVFHWIEDLLQLRALIHPSIHRDPVCRYHIWCWSVHVHVMIVWLTTRQTVSACLWHNRQGKHGNKQMSFQLKLWVWH